MAAVSIVVLPIFLLCLFATVFVAVFVYKDAQKRDMNAIGWTLIVVLVPLFLGLIIYLLCRKPLMNLQCPKCGAGVTQYDKTCPQCGNTFVTQCPECDFPVQRGWSACPSCGNKLPEDYGQPVRSYRKDNGIWILMIVVVLVLLAFFLATFSIFRIKSSGSSFEEGFGYGGFEGMYNITAEDMADNATIAEWLAACDEAKDAHVLLSKASDTCLIYLPGQNTLLESNVTTEYSGSGNVYISVYVNTTEYEDRYDYDFFLYEIALTEEANVRVEVYINDRICDSTLTVTDKDISWESWGGQ